jgi:hypothetical protein
MSLANSNGPGWIRAQHVEAKKRWEGIAPIRAFLAKVLRPANRQVSIKRRVDEPPER